jgi:hypothetical protein
MAFNGVPASGPIYIAPGNSIGVWIGFGGADMGAQWIMANPVSGPTQPPASLMVSNFTKVLTYDDTIVGENGPPTYTYQNPHIDYDAVVTNTGDSGVYFNLQGGGNV